MAAGAVVAWQQEVRCAARSRPYAWHAWCPPVGPPHVALLPRENWVMEATLHAACTVLLLVQLIVGTPSAASAPLQEAAGGQWAGGGLGAQGH